MKPLALALMLGSCGLPTAAPIVIQPPSCYCVALPLDDAEHPSPSGKAAEKVQREDKAEKVQTLREQVDRAKLQVETMKGIVQQSSSPKPATTPID